MAPDRLNQLGQNLSDTNKEIGHRTRYIGKALPLIEEVNDIFGAINTFRFEFKIYTGQHATLNLVFKPKYKQIPPPRRVL